MRYRRLVAGVGVAVLCGAITWALVWSQLSLSPASREQKESAYLPAVDEEADIQTAALDGPDSSVTLLFGGDVMFDRWIRSVVTKHGAQAVLTQEIRDLFHSADVVVANLEGPITDAPSVSVHSRLGSRENYIFTFPIETAHMLKDSGITHVGLANNHILNFGTAGLASTEAALSAAGLYSFGAPGVRGGGVRIDRYGIPIALIPYNEFGDPGEEKALALIHEAAQEGLVAFVYAHWGSEYVAVLPRVRVLAQTFIDAGAAAVLGAHPHIVQEMEFYRGKPIYYSLGNLVFDQYDDEETRKGLLVKVTVKPDRSLSIQEHDVRLSPDGATTLIPRR